MRTAIRAAVVAVAVLFANGLYAQSNAQGFIYGNTPAPSGTVTVISTETGFSAQTGVSEDST